MWNRSCTSFSGLPLRRQGFSGFRRFPVWLTANPKHSTTHEQKNPLVPRGMALWVSGKFLRKKIAWRLHGGHVSHVRAKTHTSLETQGQLVVACEQAYIWVTRTSGEERSDPPGKNHLAASPLDSGLTQLMATPLAFVLQRELLKQTFAQKLSRRPKRSHRPD